MDDRKIDMKDDQLLTELLCGPFVRLTDNQQVTVWFVTSSKNPYKLSTQPEQVIASQTTEMVKIGDKCFVYQIHAKFKQQLSEPISFDYFLQKTLADKVHILDLTNHGIKPETLPRIDIGSRLNNVIQGSCRKPHHPSTDALSVLYDKISTEEFEKPDYLVMSGDQIYADDVSGPMLVAIQALSKKLGLYTATHELGAVSKQQLNWKHSLFRRSQLMPKKEQQSLLQRWWHGPDIISSRYHDNHLIGLDEFFACYLLSWSHVCWKLIWDEVKGALKDIHSEHKAEYEREITIMADFVEQLPKFEKLLANIPTIMIFDDHDVTDDWNLTVDWEEHVYGNTVTRHMIRDALLSYSIFQGWGNTPKTINHLMSDIRVLAKKKDFASDELTETIFNYNLWHYEVETTPKIVVLDTRTHRWRSESSPKNPSGLMDFERLEQFERELFKPQSSVLVVSAAPIFGVKSIEVVQKLAEMIGKELLVDVENWMAHQGSAKKLMNMLRDDLAPDEVIVLSGDVHYSFCFSAQRRFSSDTDKIWQLTCSGFKNEFPQGLINFFDNIDRFLYSKHSPLNIFTKRRKLAIEHHPLEVDSKHKKHLYSKSAAGHVVLNEKGYLQDFNIITGTGEILSFDIHSE